MGLIVVETYIFYHIMCRIVSVQKYFVWKVIERLWLVYSMPQDDAESTSMKLVRNLDSILYLCLKSLRRNICDIEVFDNVV